MNQDTPDRPLKARAEPESFRARAVTPSLTVKDLQQSLKWYEGVVGFTVGEKYEMNGVVAGAELKAGDITVMLGQDDGKKGWDRAKGEGFSLYITTAQNVDEIAALIKERGGSLVSEPEDMPWGARMFSIKDPDGFKIVISSER